MTTMVYILLAAFQRKLSLPSSACPSVSERPPRTAHTGQGRRRRRGRASRRRPAQRPGPAFLGAPRLFTPRAAPGRGRPCTPAAGTARGAEAQGASGRSADTGPPAFPRWNRGLSPQQGQAARRGPLPPCFADGRPRRDPRVERGARERRHGGRDRREAATARPTAGDSAGRPRGGRPSAAAQCPARRLHGRGPERAPRARRTGRARRRGRSAALTRGEQEGRPRGRSRPGERIAAQDEGPACPGTGQGRRPGEPPPSHLRPISRVWGNLPPRLRDQEVISRGKTLQRQGLGPPSAKPCYHLLVAPLDLRIQTRFQGISTTWRDFAEGQGPRNGHNLFHNRHFPPQPRAKLSPKECQEEQRWAEEIRKSNHHS